MRPQQGSGGVEGIRLKDLRIRMIASILPWIRQMAQWRTSRTLAVCQEGRRSPMSGTSGGEDRKGRIITGMIDEGYDAETFPDVLDPEGAGDSQG